MAGVLSQLRLEETCAYANGCCRWQLKEQPKPFTFKTLNPKTDNCDHVLPPGPCYHYLFTCPLMPGLSPLALAWEAREGTFVYQGTAVSPRTNAASQKVSGLWATVTPPFGTSTEASALSLHLLVAARPLGLRCLLLSPSLVCARCSFGCLLCLA